MPGPLHLASGIEKVPRRSVTREDVSDYTIQSRETYDLGITLSLTRNMWPWEAQFGRNIGLKLMLWALFL